MWDIPAAITAVFKFLHGTTDPDKKTTGYNLSKRKDKDKAIDTAQKMFFTVNDFLDDAMTKDQLRVKFAKLWKIFFEND